MLRISITINNVTRMEIKTMLFTFRNAHLSSGFLGNPLTSRQEGHIKQIETLVTTYIDTLVKKST